MLLGSGGIDPLALPFLIGCGFLVFALNRYQAKTWQIIGWTVFVVLALALGLRVFPFFTPVETLQTVEHVFRFPPEKAVLILLVPTMVLVPWSVCKRSEPPERPWLVALLVLAAILVVVAPLALLTGFIKPGFAPQSAEYLVYWLAYNLIYTCVIEESFFRGIIQTAFIRGFSQKFETKTAHAAGIAGAALLFGVAHFAGGLTYVILATIAGVGYGLAYELTGRLHYAVLVHFAVNTVHILAFSGI